MAAHLNVSYGSLQFKTQLRDGVAPIEACAFNTVRREFLAVDVAALRVWDVRREVKAIMAAKVSSPAIAAFCLEQSDLYIVIYGGRKRDRRGVDGALSAAGASGFVYDGRLRLLSRFNPCECEAVSATFYPITGALLISGSDGNMRVIRITSRKLPPAPIPWSTTAVKGLQVTVKEIQALRGPPKVLPMELLEIDTCSGLVVGMNGTDAFLWQLPFPREPTSAATGYSTEANNVPSFDDAIDAGGGEGDAWRERYSYLGAMPDLHSSEVTALSVKSPLLATGLANGRIFLWRVQPQPGNTKRTVLSVVEAHDGRSILSLRLLRAGGSRGVAPGGFSCEDGTTTGDWSIMSGGADGMVAHWSVLGFAGEGDVAGSGEGVVLHKIGAYEMTRKSPGMMPVSSAERRRPNTDIDRNPPVTHIMSVRLATSEPPILSSTLIPGTGVAAAVSAIESRTRNTSDTPPSVSSPLVLAEEYARRRRGNEVGSCGSGGGRDTCIAISGGLMAVLETVEPLWHVGWAESSSSTPRECREVVRMARMPPQWGFVDKISGGTLASEGKQCGRSHKPSFGESSGEEDDNISTTTEGTNRGSGFLAMCESGWLGWYRECYQSFELISCIDLPPAEKGGEVFRDWAKATCFAACPTASIRTRNSRIDPSSRRSRVTASQTSGNASHVPLIASESEPIVAYDTRVVVGYSDGSIASVAMPPPIRASSDGVRQDPERVKVRRLQRKKVGGGSGVEAGITVLCSLSAPFGLLAVAGDADGRLGLWTTSSLPSNGSPLLWEGKHSHRGPVVAIQRIQEAASDLPFPARAHIVGAPPPPPPPRPCEWVVTAGSGGEVRVWKVPSRWPGWGAGVRRPIGLEFCATLITNSSICSFSCVLLCPAGGNGGGGVHGQSDERGQGNGGDSGRKRPSQRWEREEKGNRLYCIVGSENGFVQAWEMSLVGEKGVGGQPLWAQKVHDGAVTSVDACGVRPPGFGSKGFKRCDYSSNTTATSVVNRTGWQGGRQAHVGKQNDNRIECMPSATSTTGVEHGDEGPTPECVVVSGSLDRSVCLFRAGFGEGLQLLRRLNMACAPTGLPGALIVGLPEGGGADLAKDKNKVGILLAAANGEITRLGLEYRPCMKQAVQGVAPQGGDIGIGSAPSVPLPSGKDFTSHGKWRELHGHDMSTAGYAQRRSLATIPAGGSILENITGTVDRGRVASRAPKSCQGPRESSTLPPRRNTDDDMVGRWESGTEENASPGGSVSYPTPHGLSANNAPVATAASFGSKGHQQSVHQDISKAVEAPIKQETAPQKKKKGADTTECTGPATFFSEARNGESALERHRHPSHQVGSTQSLNSGGEAAWRGGQKRPRDGDGETRSLPAPSSSGRGLPRTRSCERMLEKKELNDKRRRPPPMSAKDKRKKERGQGEVKPASQKGHGERETRCVSTNREKADTDQVSMSTATTKDGFVGDVGRWQQGLGITSVDGTVGDGGIWRRPTANSTTAVRNLMKDGRLREAFAARRQQKQSPVVGRDIKAIFKTWSPGVVEACSRASFAAALGGLGADECVTFERTCKIAATLLASLQGKSSKPFARPAAVVACTERGEVRIGGSVQPPRVTSARPAQYQEMANSKTRLEYNSMGERVVVRTALYGIDAFAARSRHCSSQQEPKRSKSSIETRASKTDMMGADATGVGGEYNNGSIHRQPLDDDQMVDTAQEGENPPESSQVVVSKSLGFGFKDYSSVASRVAGTFYAGEEVIDAARPSRASAACLGDVPTGLRGVFSRQGSRLFSSWSESHLELSKKFLPGGTAGTAEILGEGECVRVVRELLDSRAAAFAGALVACRRLGRCAPGAHSPVIGGCDQDNEYIFSGTVPPHPRDTKTRAGASPSSSLGATPSERREDTAKTRAITASSGGEAENPTQAKRDEAENAIGQVGAVPGEERSLSYPGCPVANLEPVGVMLYLEFRRRYGLQRTAEERVAGLLGSIIEHARTSALLRLFTRILGVPADGTSGGRWPWQTKSEDANQGLEAKLAGLVTTARDWLIVRGFMTMDGPWAGGKQGGGSSTCIGWRKAVVVRTHAAMCAAAMLKPGWGPGHRVMGEAEQVILDLPTVGASGRWAGQRGLEHWSESVDGEEFLEALLSLVLRAREISGEATERLFGVRAVAGHLFLRSRPRDINAEVTTGLKRSDVPGALDEAHGGSSSPFTHESANSRVLSETTTANQPGSLRKGGDGFENISSGGHDSSTDALKITGDGTRGRVEDLLDGGRVLKRLKPLLDSFIQEDTHRTGTLPAADFRRILCEGHGGLWPSLCRSLRTRVATQQRYSTTRADVGGTEKASAESPTEYTDPCLTAVENTAACVLIRRFADALDGQVCYLDVWITLYHSVFRSGQIVPFVDLPALCETQLRGADTEHWEALLVYLDAVAIRTPPPQSNTGNGSATNPNPFSAVVGSGIAEPKQPQGEKQVREAAMGKLASSERTGSDMSLAREQIAPTGLLRTATAGGASSSYHTSGGPASRAPFAITNATTVTVGVATEWPLAGWGPGSLTVTSLPQEVRRPGTAIFSSSTMASLHSAAGLGPRGTAGCSFPSKGGGEVGMPSGSLATSSSVPGVASSEGRLLPVEQTPPVLVSLLPTEEVQKAQEATEAHQAPSSVGRALGVSEEGLLHRVDGMVGTVINGGDIVTKDQFPATSNSRSQQKNDEHLPQTTKVGTPSFDREGEHKLPEEDDTRLSSEGNGDRSLSGDMLLYNLDCGTLEPPSPEPPSPEWEGKSVGSGGSGDRDSIERLRRNWRKKRDKRTMTSLYIRCPFLDPVKSKHAYRVPSGGLPAYFPVSAFHEESDAASIAAQLYASIMSSKAKTETAYSKLEAQRRQFRDTQERLGPKRMNDQAGGADTMTGDEKGLVVQFPPSLKEAMLQEGRSKSREKRRAEEGKLVPGVRGGGGKGGEEALFSSAEGHESWTAEQRMNSPVDAVGLAFDTEHFVLEGTATEKRVASPRAPRTSSRGSANQQRPPSRTPSPSRPLHVRRDVCADAEKSYPARAGGDRPPDKHKDKPKVVGGGRRGRRARRGRRGPQSGGSSDDDRDERVSAVGAKKAAQKKLIEDMMAKQAAKRRESGEAMKRLIAEEEKRKRLRREEEEAAMLAQERAKEEAEERARKDLEERRKALAKKRAEVEESNQRIEEDRVAREAEKALADQVRCEESEKLQRIEAARRVEEAHLAREEKFRLAREEEERVRVLEEEKIKAEEEAMQQRLLEIEVEIENGEKERMARHDEDVDVIIQEHLAAKLEVETREREAEAARKSERLKNVATEARRKHACLLMSKSDEESRLWNDCWRAEGEAATVEVLESTKKEKRERVRVICDKNGNPIDVRLWEIECTAETDADGRLIQRQTYGIADRFTFDPRDVYRGGGGGIGGRGGSKGNSMTRPHTVANPTTERSEEMAVEDEDGDTNLDAQGFLERERRWIEGIFAAARPEDLSCLFRDTAGSGKLNPNEFFPMVLTERVAWTEYLDMARDALFKQADALIGKQAAADSTTGRIGKGGDLSDAIVPVHGFDGSSDGSTADSAAPGSSPGNVRRLQEVSPPQHHRQPRRRRQHDDGSRHRFRSRGDSDNNYGRSSSASARLRPSLGGITGGDLTVGEDGRFGTVPRIEFGRSYRGMTIAGAEEWSLFRFNLPSAGPVLTIVVDPDDGDPELFVSRGSQPTLADERGWESSSKHGRLRVVKIFPHDSNYGPGDHYIGVLSRGIPSSFSLRVSAASAEDEMSTHMKTAVAIVDNLAIMSKMDTHRLVKDFVGARLEAEETLRKQKVEAEGGGLDKPLWHEDATPPPHHLQEFHPNNSFSHGLAPDPYVISAPPAVTPSECPTPTGRTTSRQSTTSALSAAPLTTATATTAATSSCTASNIEDVSKGRDSVVLSALGQRERDLLSPVAVLDDRMTRIRPAGLLASSVSASVVVSHSLTPSAAITSGGGGLGEVGIGRRPWTTSHCRAEGAGEKGRPRAASFERSRLDPFRYSVRRFEDSYIRELRLGGVRVRHLPPALAGNGEGRTDSSKRHGMMESENNSAPFDANVACDGDGYDPTLGETYPRPDAVAIASVKTAEREGRRERGGGALTNPRPSINRQQAQQHRSSSRDAIDSNEGSGAFIRFGDDHDMLPILPLSPPRRWSVNSLVRPMTVGSPWVPPRASSKSSGSLREKRRVSTAPREEGGATDGKSRQVAPNATPNLFPEICGVPSGRDGSGAELRGWRGWLPGL